MDINSSLTFLQLKGGTGKSTLIASMAHCAASIEGWTTVIVDLDANSPIIAAVLGDLQNSNTVIDALERVAEGNQLDDLLVPAPAYGTNTYLLPSDVSGIRSELVEFIPDLISELKRTYIGDNPVDFVLVDTPANIEDVNIQVLAGVDYVAMPMSFSGADVSTARRTVGFITYSQNKRPKALKFHGFVPTMVRNNGSIDKLVVGDKSKNFVTDLIGSRMLLPFIPVSEHLRGTFLRSSKDGGVTPLSFAPRSAASARLMALWQALRSSNPDRDLYEVELRHQIGLNAEENNGAQ